MSDLALAGSPQSLQMLQALEDKQYLLLPSLLKSVSNGLANAEFTEGGPQILALKTDLIDWFSM